MAVKPEVMDYINSNAEMAVSEAKEIIETSISKEVNIEFDEANEFSFDDLSSLYTESVVAIDFQLAGAEDSKMQLFIDKTTAARIGSLMMMMEVEDDEKEIEFSDDHIDAAKEMTNQILGAVSTKMKKTGNNSASFDSFNGQVVELNADMFEQPDLIMSKFSLKIGDSEPKTVTAVITTGAIETLIQGEAGKDTKVEESPEAETEVVEEAGAGEEAAVAADDKFDISGVLGGEETEVAEEKPEVPAPEARQEVTEVESKFGFLMDLTFKVSIELGRTKMLIKDILDLGHGSVIEFEKLAGEPVDLLIDEKKIGEGEVVILEEHFGIRITSLEYKEKLLREISARKNNY